MFESKRKYGTGRRGVDYGRGHGVRHSGRNELPCSHFRNGTCKFGSSCRFSHVLDSGDSRYHKSAQRDKKAHETPEEQLARTNYGLWRRLIRRGTAEDLCGMKAVWDGALDILNGGDRDSKQNVPKDLDNDDDYLGRHHIKALLSKRAHGGGHHTLIEVSRSFLLVMTHTAMVDCLSVDTYVGSLYSFISGPNGTRAIPFLQHLCEILVASRAEKSPKIPPDRLDSTLVALSGTLFELLRREVRARYNEAITDLIESLETAGHLITEEASTVTSDTIANRARDLRAIVARANGLLSDETDLKRGGHATSVPRSGYPRDMIAPGERHDNDKADITKINVFPTRAEILSDAREYLPSTDPDQPHFLTSKLERHIDTNFRLLRHDTFGKLKDDLGGLIKRIVGDSNHLSNPKLDLGDTRTYTYPSSFVRYLLLGSRGGLQAQISFSHPHLIRGKPITERRQWWEESRRLEEGVLLSFIWIQDSIVQHLFFTVAVRSTDTRNGDGLTHSNTTATITVRLVTQDPQAVETLLDLSRQKVRGVLLEFPHVLPATFVPVLANLQNMQRLSRLPFREWILPDRIDGPPGAKLDIPPPLYARHAGFTFPLDSILSPGAETMSLDPFALRVDPALLAELDAKTGLDHGQCAALVAALTREFAFIQGPPGTGKSYLGLKLMNVLLDVKKKADLGPIVIVCYTNHALDQFLEHLLNTGITKVIRVGGQSRSEMLENHSLRTITQTEAKTKHESWQAATAYATLSEQEAKSERILSRLHGIGKRIEWKYFERHMSRNYNRIYLQFKLVGSDGFTAVGRHPFDLWALSDPSDEPSNADSGKESTMSDPESIVRKAEKNVQSLSYAERRILVGFWSQELQQDAAEEFFELIKDSDAVQRDLTHVHEEINRRVLQAADVVGLTTSGLAKNISTLQHVRCKVMICEEAGEVMEPHMISALLPTVEHFIQIGDHQQLRPSINNFQDLSLESPQGVLYQLDRSQFERLSVSERGRPSVPVAQLNVQRRMRPDISTLIRETMYEKLTDHPSTVQLPDVVGMRKNVFWLSHDNTEDDGQAEVRHKKSKCNEWEVGMVHALVRHLVRQGVYTSSDIAVLTPYTGQLQKLRTRMRDDFEIILSERDQDALRKDGFIAQDPSEDQPTVMQDMKRKPLERKKLSDLLRIATVDNFQGEEAKIIIISLVRSNKERNVGFLKTTNRINVLLSRAQHGMYLIGNTDTYSNVPMWQKVINMLDAKDSVGPSLDLCCPRHIDNAIQIQQPDDFAKFSPEGGCREPCMARLPDCGHRCQARCHSKAMHEVFRCEKPCQRRHKPCDHLCQKSSCGEDCGRCTVALHSVEIPCGHIKDNVPCYLSHNLDAITCSVIVDKTVPDCGHVVQVQCSQEVNKKDFRCPSPCGMTLTCGHPCPGSCGRCNTKDEVGSPVRKHSKCHRVCGRGFGTCNHNCSRRCHDGSECGLCMLGCEVACKHSRCTLKCHEACTPCIEQCTWSCPHQGECTMPCSAPCNRLPCNKRCAKLLSCGHQCPGLCGEECLSSYCQECGMKLDAQVDMLELKEYNEIDLDETPVVALTCGHFFTAETLDGVIGLKEVYEIDPVTSNILDLKDISSQLASATPKCPHCQRPIRQYATQRYNRLINRAVIDEMSKRFIVTGQTDLQDIQAKLSNLEAELEDTRPNATGPEIIPFITDRPDRVCKSIPHKLQARYKTSAQLRSAIVQLQRRAAERHQPAHKLYEATVYAMRRNAPPENALAAVKLGIPLTPERDYRITLGAKMMEIKIDTVVIEDKLLVFSAVKARYKDTNAPLVFPKDTPSSLVGPFLQSCTDFITTCSETALPKLAVEGSLYYARIARLFETSGLVDPKDRRMATVYHDEAKDLLARAKRLCAQGFRNAETLLLAVDESLELLAKEWYEGVTIEELEAIKKAMVHGPEGIATHSGHWYNCANGHPFAIGECGMPMELARCPECGARIGGQHHEAVQGVTRAEYMER